MTNLYNIQQDYLELMSMLEHSEGELTEEQLEMLNINESEFQNKTANYIKIIKSWKDELLAIKGETERLAALKKTREANIERLKESLKAALISREIATLQVGTDRLSFRKSNSVNILDEEQIPSEYKLLKTTISMDKKALLGALRAGEEIPGAALLEKQNLQIK